MLSFRMHGVFGLTHAIKSCILGNVAAAGGTLVGGDPYRRAVGSRAEALPHLHSTLLVVLSQSAMLLVPLR